MPLKVPNVGSHTPGEDIQVALGSLVISQRREAPTVKASPFSCSGEPGTKTAGQFLGFIVLVIQVDITDGSVQTLLVKFSQNWLS